MIDPEYRRILLEEIAFQRVVRDVWKRKELDQSVGPVGAAHARHMADRARYTMRALRDVWDAMRHVERQRAEQYLNGCYSAAGEW
jgi:hypothetical protein